MTIAHSIAGISGSITKLEILPINLLTSLNNISVTNTITYANIVTSGSFEEVEIVPEAGFKTKSSDTENGPLQSLEVTGMLMNDDESVLFQLLFNRYVLLITDGVGKRWLFGNKTEYLKLEVDNDSNTSRGNNKIKTLMFKGAITTALLQVL
jgi:hypothetical protein